MEITTEIPIEVTSAELIERRAGLLSELAGLQTELAELDDDITKAINFGV